MMKCIASHLVMLKGEDGLMATPPVFVLSRACKGILPCHVSVHCRWLHRPWSAGIIEPLGASDSGVHQVHHGVKVTHQGGAVFIMVKPKQ